MGTGATLAKDRRVIVVGVRGVLDEEESSHERRDKLYSVAKLHGRITELAIRPSIDRVRHDIEIEQPLSIGVASHFGKQIAGLHLADMKVPVSRLQPAYR